MLMKFSPQIFKQFQKFSHPGMKIIDISIIRNKTRDLINIILKSHSECQIQ